MSGEVGFGSWFEHTLGWWEAHTAPEGKILWVTYEQLKQEPDTTIGRIAEFLDVELTDGLLARVKAASSFEKMSENNEQDREERSAGGGRDFFRKGETGDWRNHFSDAQNEEFDALCKRRWTASVSFHVQMKILIM